MFEMRTYRARSSLLPWQVFQRIDEISRQRVAPSVLVSGKALVCQERVHCNSDALQEDVVRSHVMSNCARALLRVCHLLLLSQEFPRAGSRSTPVHPAADFVWKDYAPAAFRWVWVLRWLRRSTPALRVSSPMTPAGTLSRQMLRAGEAGLSNNKKEGCK
jgi:hypothetical protein